MQTESTKIQQNGHFEQPQRYARQNFGRFVSQLQEFIKFQSVSTENKYSNETENCAGWLANHLLEIGLRRIKIFPTNGNPIVYGELIYDETLPTLLIYGHYDVVPAGEYENWAHPPFSGIVSNNRIYGRGASDNKGQLFTHLKAIESILRAKSYLPINIKCVFEGEEEIGSPHFQDFVIQNADLLRANCAVISDMDMISENQPALTYGMRGNLSATIKVKTSENDLHSGNFGGAIANPILILSQILNQLQDFNSKILIPNFYDKVEILGNHERNYFQTFGKSNQQIFSQAKTFQLDTEYGFNAQESIAFRPSLTVTSFKGGYQGEGLKSIIPSEAVAKLNFRLVSHQNPYEIAALLRKHIKNIVPPSIDIEVDTHAHAFPYEIPTNHFAFQAAKSAYEIAFEKKVILQKSGGTIPALNIFKKNLGIESIMMGFGNPDDNKHATNEYFPLSSFYKGILTSIAFMNNLGIGVRQTAKMNTYFQRN